MTAAHATRAPGTRTGLHERWSRRRIMRAPLGFAAWSILATMLVLVLLGPLLITTDPQAQEASAFLPVGSSGHLLGTDDLGRDLLARLLAGGRPFLVVCLVSTLLATLIGSAVGIVAGFRGGWIDAVLMRAVDVLLAFPLVLVAILMVAVLGGGSANLVIAITISQAPTFARLTRNLAAAEAGRDYVRASRALGFRTPHILAREVLPNVTGQILVQATSTLAVTAGLSSALSYLGLGQSASSPDWGYMVRSGQEFVFSTPSLALLPAALITVIAVAANFTGDDLRDSLDIGRL